jgi:transcriptional regulator with XRE-family HTH domain
MDFGNKIKKIRLQCSLNQLQFAEKLNIDASQYSKIERGIILPTLSQIMDIISMFKINSAWLLEDTGKMLKEKSFTEQFRNFFHYYKKGDREYETKKDELYKVLDTICNRTGKTIEEISLEQYRSGYTIEKNIKNDMLLSNMTSYLKRQYAFCFIRDNINYEAVLEEKEKIINSQKDEIINLQRKLLEAKEIFENK